MEKLASLLFISGVVCAFISLSKLYGGKFFVLLSLLTTLSAQNNAAGEDWKAMVKDNPGLKNKKKVEHYSLLLLVGVSLIFLSAVIYYT